VGTVSVSERLDAYQQRHPGVGFPLAVVYKFTDDQGGYLAALITYYGFLSLFSRATRTCRSRSWTRRWPSSR